MLFVQNVWPGYDKLGLFHLELLYRNWMPLLIQGIENQHKKLGFFCSLKYKGCSSFLERSSPAHGKCPGGRKLSTFDLN